MALLKAPAHDAPSVRQEEGKEVPTEVLAQAIVGISEGIKKLRGGPLTERCLLLLIQDAAPSCGGKWGRSPLTVKQIKSVLDGIEGLSKRYVKSKPGGK